MSMIQFSLGFVTKYTEHEVCTHNVSQRLKVNLTLTDMMNGHRSFLSYVTQRFLSVIFVGWKCMYSGSGEDTKTV